jgi:hypothetical protein
MPMPKIELHQELYSLNDTRDILSKAFKGWSSKYKISAVFQYHPEYEVIKMGEGQGLRYFIKKEKLAQFMEDIEAGKIN